jgi:type III restriction enzyme
MELFKFQSKASTQIADRFYEYMQNPLYRTRDEIVPFFQNLSAITGAGKTLILTDAITQMRIKLPIEPIVLWVSKGKVVVSQTYNNLSVGKYSEFIPNFKVLPLLECNLELIEDSSIPLLLVATVGKFNQKDMDKGDRMVYQVNLDNADISLWEMITERRLASKELKRPLFIVYDEGHNLSDQQTDLLLKLKPDAIISASATMRIPELLYKKVLQRIIDDKGWTADDFSTVINSSDVVEKALIKKHISVGGYVTPMEMAVDELIDDYNKLCKYIDTENLGFKPKAIYVSNTNIVAETGEKDNHLLPFEQRQSRPIQIWKRLVQNGIDANDIAIYCDLRFDVKLPPPENFHLFSGGDNDYERFIEGNFHHIIFNLSLQEGWDDPLCYFAYIDKDMGSKDQVTQVIGRVLRQTNAQHYPFADLNAAHLYIRTDSKNVFDEVIEEIKENLVKDTPEVTLSVYKGKSNEKNSNKIAPRKVMELPITTIDATNAVSPIKNIIAMMVDFSHDKINTVGTGSRIKVLQHIGKASKRADEWIETEHTNRITARWLFKRELQKYFPKVVNLCDTELPLFDALIEYNSKAAQVIRENAISVVNAYIEYAVIVHDSANTFTVPAIYINPENAIAFKYSLHEKYSDFNQFELEFAQELDKTKFLWFRNPKQGCFSIPLLDKGDTNTFNPDFIVLCNKNIIAIDTKGDHLINSDAARKLFTLKKYGKGKDLFIRLVTQGEWTSEIRKIGKNGYTVWSFKNGKIVSHHVSSLSECVKTCLIIS